MSFSILPGDAQMVELRAQLRRDGAPLTEVWLYRWTV
jgi:glucans biosynthesis protein